mgnify:CR=1 FL=1|jgi:hypothetical protein
MADNTQENTQEPQGLIQTVIDWIKNNLLLTIAIVVSLIAAALYFLKLGPFSPTLPGTDLSEYN